MTGLTFDKWWSFVVKHEIEPMLRAFCQPRLTDGAPLTPIALKPLPKERE
jgi:hypothetical protein